MVLQSRMKICTQSERCVCSLKTQFEGMTNIKFICQTLLQKLSESQNVTFGTASLFCFNFILWCDTLYVCFSLFPNWY